LLSPEKLISFNLDGILEIFLELEENEKETISNTIKKIIKNLNDEERKKILIMIPNNAKKHLKF
jgi:ATP-dependent RNA circularization protein (DNA/RNA ligase family)